MAEEPMFKKNWPLINSNIDEQNVKKNPNCNVTSTVKEFYVNVI
jgi:hypothetical protein